VNYYTYILTYPESMGEAVFYVGKGTGDRIDHHEIEAKKGVKSAKCDTIRLVWSKGEQVVKAKVFETEIEQDAYIYEWILINLVYGYDTLTNIKEGGNGGIIEREWAYECASITLPSDLSEALTKIGNYTRYLSTLLSFRLANEQMVRHLMDILPRRRARIHGQRRNLHTTYLQLPTDVALNLKRIPRDQRSLVVEYFIREDLNMLEQSLQVNSNRPPNIGKRVFIAKENSSKVLKNS
jgi:hypothetical protein